MSIHGYAAMAAGKPLEKYSYEPKNVGPLDVEVAIDHCGICHSDIHLIHDDWYMSQYPFIPGHEIIGRVTAVGGLVRGLVNGQRVGIGWQRGACLACEWCLSGQENLCPANEATCVGHHGGFAQAIRIDSRFVYDIPESLPSTHAGPLLCAGLTVYSPLRRYGITPPMKVGVVGIGGLGHLALQYARAFGCEVTAFTTSPDKEKEAQHYGAHRVINAGNLADLEKMAGTLDFILSTVFADLNWAAYVNILRPNGKLCLVGAPLSAIPIPAFPLIMGQKSLCGSVIGGRNMMREMLEFSARHSILPQIEQFPMERVNEALERVEKNQARYRVVLDR